jgi:polysaccharide biosynthesis protein PslG
LVLALAVLLVFVPASSGVTARTPYGLVVTNGNFVPGEGFAERVAAYRKLHRAGVGAVRIDVNWTMVEPPGPPLHDYDFSERDREIRAIRRAGLRLIVILAYGHPDYSSLAGLAQATPIGNDGIPPFQLGSTRAYPPDRPADFARYATDTARHLRVTFPGTVIAWEIWNEQNQGYRFWFPHEDPAAYARLLCETYPALKKVTPRLPVVFGGMFYPAVAGLPGQSAPQFLDNAYRANPGLGRCFDAMAYHPYPYPFTAPELELPIRGSVLSAYDQMRAVLRRNGNPAKPLWITEVGWPTHDRSYGVPEAKQAQYVARMQAASFAQGIPVLTWYTYGDAADPSGGLNQEAWFGLFRPNGSPKPAYTALKVFARAFRGTRFARDRSAELGLPRGAMFSGGRGFALEYRGKRRTVTALWLAGESVLDGQGSFPQNPPKTRRVAVPVHGSHAWALDFLGRSSRRLRAQNGRLSLTIGPSPIYLLDGPSTLRRGPKMSK